jgi:hypothetical protein
MWGSILRCSKRLAAVGLLVVGVLLALANLWFAAARSTIPLALDARVLTKERRPEKHKGIDDVYLLKLAGGVVLQVDQAIFDSVDERTSLQKTAWSTRLQSGDKRLELHWSADVYGMLWVMPIVAIASLWLCLRASSAPQLELKTVPGEHPA